MESPRLTVNDKLFAGADADNPLHVGEVFDRLAVDRGHDVADLEAGRCRCTSYFDLVDSRRHVRFAEKGEQAGEDHDRQNEIGDRTGGDDRRARSDFLVMETAARSSSVMLASASADGVEASLSSPKNLT